MFVQQPNDEVSVIEEFSFIYQCHAVRSGSEFVWNVSLVGQVWTQDVSGV